MDVITRVLQLRGVQALGRFFGSRKTLIGFAWASIIGNSLLVVTGAVVRLTGSGLGCPTWPRCTTESFVSTPEMGLHGVIEFGNRLLTFVLIAIAIGTLLTAWLQRNRQAWDPKIKLLATLMALGIPVQGVIGGITVLTDLTWYIVALHLLVSVALLCLAVVLLRRAKDSPVVDASSGQRRIAVAVFGLAWLAVLLGTVVTGSGPHSGDADVARANFDIETIAKMHAWVVWLLVIATVYLVVKLRSRAAITLLIVELVQGTIGYVQYFTGVPVVLVAAHMLGITVVMALSANLMLSVRPRRKAGDPAGLAQKTSGSMATAMNSSAR